MEVAPNRAKMTLGDNSGPLAERCVNIATGGRRKPAGPDRIGRNKADGLAAATFENRISGVTRSHAGKAVVRYAW
jgi:hypothetical protein